MCIIIAKKTGVNVPDNSTIENCFLSNPDGAGVAYWKNGLVFIEKGFMDVESFKGRLKALPIDKNTVAIYHFRIGTHGAKSQENCHPFPISPRMNDLKKLKTVCKMGVAHNGIFSQFERNEHNSDTQKFITFILSNFRHSDFDQWHIKELLRGYCGYSSKLAIIKDGKILTIGDFTNDNGGLLFSNGSYRPVTALDTLEKALQDVKQDFIDQCAFCGRVTDTEYILELDDFLCPTCEHEFFKDDVKYLKTNKKQNKFFIN